MAGFKNNPSYPATQINGVIGADVSLAQNVLTTVQTTASLAAGTWLITFAGNFYVAVALESIDYEVVLGTALGALSGNLSGTTGYTTAGTNTYSKGSLSFVATITTAGTLTFQAQMTGAATAAAAKAASLTRGTPGATGYVALKIG